MTKKNIFVGVFTVVLFIPQITFAVWWNPTTWSKPKTPIKQEALNVEPVNLDTIQDSQKPSVLSASSSNQRIKKNESAKADVKVTNTIPITIEDSPVLDSSYSAYFKYAKEQSKKYSIEINSNKDEVKGSKVFNINVKINDVLSKKRGSLSLINIKCSNGLEVKMLLSGDVCKKKSGSSSEFNVNSTSKLGKGDIPLFVKGKGTIYAEIIVTFPPEEKLDTYTPQIFLYKGITFNVK